MGTGTRDGGSFRCMLDWLRPPSRVLTPPCCSPLRWQALDGTAAAKPQGGKNSTTLALGIGGACGQSRPLFHAVIRGPTTRPPGVRQGPRNLSRGHGRPRGRGGVALAAVTGAAAAPACCIAEALVAGGEVSPPIPCVLLSHTSNTCIVMELFPV